MSISNTADTPGTSFRLPSLAAMSAQQMVLTTLLLVCGKGNVVEIRCLGADGNRKRTDSGYFNDFRKAAEAIVPYLKDKTRGVYATLNQINPSLLSRSVNRIKQYSETTTSDLEVIRRRWLYIDLDPVRPSNISSEECELSAARVKAAEIVEWLMGNGFAEPITAMSGNGVHLLFPIDLPNNPESLSLVNNVLKAISNEHSDQFVKVDQTVGNASRIFRLYGTTARKGDNTRDRPHRQSGLIQVPDYILKGSGDVCSIEALQHVAAMAPTSISRRDLPRSENHAVGNHRLILDEYLADRGIGFTVKDGKDGWKNYNLDECPWDPNHKSPDSMVSQSPEGMLVFRCFHDSCSQRKWQDFKECVGKPDPHHYDPPLLKTNGKRQRTEEATSDLSAQQSPSDPNRPKIRFFDDEDMTDLGNARHFVKRNSGRVLYCHAWRKWLVWDGTRWKPDNDQGALRLAKDTVSEIFTAALDLKKNEEELRFAVQSAKLPRIQAMLTLAGPEMPVGADEFDRNEWLFNCANGTVDLRTGQRREHRRGDLITKFCPTEYEPDAECPIFMRFLHEVFQDHPEVVGFLARLIGYCFSGSVQEQKLPFFYGKGSNGKSTLLNVLLKVLGNEYGMQCESDFLTEKHTESHPTERADLFGKRLAICSETGNLKRLDEAKAKILTGGEKVRARRMREDFWEFDPTHKLILCTNHKPGIKGTDHGIWRRVLLVPFTRKFEGKDIDKTLPEKLKAEYPGILAWAIQGCREWITNGLNPPEIVLAATTAYQADEDVVGRFISAWCFVGKSESVRFKFFYERFQTWCEDTGDSLPARKTVTKWLRDNGYEDYTSDGTCFRGLSLRPDY